MFSGMSGIFIVSDMTQVTRWYTVCLRRVTIIKKALMSLADVKKEINYCEFSSHS